MPDANLGFFLNRINPPFKILLDQHLPRAFMARLNLSFNAPSQINLLLPFGCASKAKYLKTRNFAKPAILEWSFMGPFLGGKKSNNAS